MGTSELHPHFAVVPIIGLEIKSAMDLEHICEGCNLEQ